MNVDFDKIKVKNHKMGLWSFLCSLAPIVWIIIMYINDMISIKPVDANFMRITYITMIIFLLVNTIGIIIGIIALLKIGYKKSLAIWGIIINSIFPILSIIGFMN